MPTGIEWLPNWLGVSYARLCSSFGEEPFTFEDASRAIASGNPRLVISLLRRKGWLHVFGRRGKKRSYRVLRPDLAIDLLALGTYVSPKQERYATLIAYTVRALRQRYGDRLRSIAIFGSIARGRANLDSDMDVLVVDDFRGDVTQRIDELVEIEYSGEVGRELAWLSSHGVRCHISWFPLTVEEAAQFRPLYLDMVEEALIVYDRDGFLRSILNELGRILEKQGAVRVWLDKDRWYWKLKPTIATGALVSI